MPVAFTLTPNDFLPMSSVACVRAGDYYYHVLFVCVCVRAREGSTHTRIRIDILFYQTVGNQCTARKDLNVKSAAKSRIQSTD